MENIKLDNNINMRDLGGLPVDGGFIVKNKCFIRSASIGDLTQNDIRVLKEDYNLKTIIDLRNSDEIKSCPDVKIKGVKYYRIPILVSDVEGITRSKSNKVKMDKVPKMAELYTQMVSSYSCCSQIKKVLKIIMKEKNHCVLFHCSVGKDRTGIIALLILSMLGVDIEKIKEDYLYTNVINVEEANKYYEFLLEKTRDEEFAAEYREVYLAKEEYFDAAVNYILEEYGSIKDFIIYELGISEKHIDNFKNNCLVRTN